jgi:hypothetical protein
VNFKNLADRAKDMFNKRGGSEAAKADLGELKDIAGSDESLGDKARDAAEALKDPGAPGAGGPGPSTTPTEPTSAETPPPADAPPTDRPAQP